MADTVDIKSVENLRKQISDMTDLGRNLAKQFRAIADETNVIGTGFTKLINDAKVKTNLAEKYLLSQKLEESVQNRINDLKSKTLFMDSTAIDFKREEVRLQNDIAAAQIRALNLAQTTSTINNSAINDMVSSLKIQQVLRDAELSHLDSVKNTQNAILNQLTQQRDNIRSFAPDLTGTLGKYNSIREVLNSIGDTIVKDFGKLGEYLSDGFKGTLDPLRLVNDYLTVGFNNFKSFDSATVKARQSLGLLPGQANVLEKNIKRTTIELMHLGATFDDVSKSVQAIASEITGILADDVDLLKTTTAVAKQFGISETTSAKFLKTLGGISGTSSSSQQSMIGFAQKISAASKVPLDILMKDVAEASDDTRIYVGNSAVSLVKAAAAARMLGTDLNKAAASAEKLLQFESSIGAELKASALLGQNINFNYARQLSFNKNIIGANQEILRIAKQVNFNQLNPIQQKAFADAAGKSVGELQDMFQQEKNIALVRNGTNKEAKKALADYERMMKLKDDEAKNEGERAAQEIIRRANQERLNQIQNRFNQLMSELAEPVMEVTEMLLDIAVKILPPIVNAIKYMTPIVGVFRSLFYAANQMERIGNALIISIKYFDNLVSRGKSLVQSLKMASSAFFTIYESGKKVTTTVGVIQKSIGIVFSIGKNILSFFTNLITKIPLIGGPLIKVLGIFGKFLGPLGVIINIFTFISSLMKRWEDSPKGFLGGLKAIGGALYDTLLKPFKDAYDWIASLFVAKSPSKLALGILQGIRSVGMMILDALISPYKFAFNSILNLFSNLGDPIINGIKSIGSTIADTLISPFKSSYNWIMDTLGGKSPSKIGLGILDGISSVESQLLEILTSPFENAFKSITNSIPVNLGSAITNSIKTELSDITLPTTKFNVENVGEPVVGKLETTNSPIQQVIEVGNQQLIQKIDQLISLMSNGGISVNLDGQLVSRTLATTAYKSGGFGQSTTRA